jgi:hypothetical protein
VAADWLFRPLTAEGLKPCVVPYPDFGEGVDVKDETSNKTWVSNAAGEQICESDDGVERSYWVRADEVK